MSCSLDKFIRMLPLHDWHKVTPYISISFNHLLLFWHHSAAYHWCTCVHLSVTQHFKKEVDLSQSVSCRVFHTSPLSVCIQPYRLFSRSCFLSAASAENSAFFHFTLTIDHFSESRHSDSNAYSISASLQGLFTRSTRCRLCSRYTCFASRKPMLIQCEKAVIWWSSALFMSVCEATLDLHAATAHFLETCLVWVDVSKHETQREWK